MMEGHPALISSCEEHTALLVKRYGAQLVGLCSRLLRDHDLAQDAVQETLLKAYLKRGSFWGENEKSEKAWLMQIAVNVCRDQMRTSWFRLADSNLEVYMLMRLHRMICMSILLLVLIFISLSALSENSKVLPIDISILEDSCDVLRLVNQENLLDRGYPDQNMPMYRMEKVRLPVTKGSHQLRHIANTALEELFALAYTEGIKLFVGSSYRAYRNQEVMHYNRVKRMGYDDGYVQRAGASEHQTGLAVDVISDEYSDLFQRSFGESREGKWLRENCAQFGFIIRYPEDKEEITGIRYEPWHLRYVGREVASYIMENGLTL